MSKKEFIEKLKANHIDPENVCFDDALKDDVFCVRNNYSIYEVFYRERGAEYNLKRFSTLSQALEYLYNRLIEITPSSL